MTNQQGNAIKNTMKSILDQHPVIPVVTLSKLAQAEPLANALMESGLAIIEITLRSPVALAAIELLRKKFPEMTIGAGTLRQPEDFFSVNIAGANFAVCPGTSLALLEESANWDIPFLPAAATPTEMMTLMDRGFMVQKFFPAKAMGGIEMISSVKGPLPDLGLCPSGGINATNFKDYLLQDQVLSVSGSWMTPTSAIENADWQSVSRLIKETQAVLSGNTA